MLSLRKVQKRICLTCLSIETYLYNDSVQTNSEVFDRYDRSKNYNRVHGGILKLFKRSYLEYC